MAVDRTDPPRDAVQQDLDITRQQALIYEAIVAAAGDAHAVLDILLDAADPDDARRTLRERYGFSEVQASAVLDVQLRRLTSSDLQRIRGHLEEVVARVAVLEEQLDVQR